MKRKYKISLAIIGGLAVLCFGIIYGYGATLTTSVLGDGGRSHMSRNQWELLQQQLPHGFYCATWEEGELSLTADISYYSNNLCRYVVYSSFAWDKPRNVNGHTFFVSIPDDCLLLTLSPQCRITAQQEKSSPVESYMDFYSAAFSMGGLGSGTYFECTKVSGGTTMISFRPSEQCPDWRMLSNERLLIGYVDKNPLCGSVTVDGVPRAWGVKAKIEIVRFL